jgi:hypothetical protein
MRLQRLYPGSVYKEEMAQAHVTLPRSTTAAGAADAVVELLRGMVPDSSTETAPAPSGAGSGSERSGAA